MREESEGRGLERAPAGCARSPTPVGAPLHATGAAAPTGGDWWESGGAEGRRGKVAERQPPVGPMALCAHTLWPESVVEWTTEF